MKKPVTLENLNQKINSEDLVLRYFKGVDKEDINAILTTLTEDCVFSIETHKIKLVGMRKSQVCLKDYGKTINLLSIKSFIL